MLGPFPPAAANATDTNAAINAELPMATRERFMANLLFTPKIGNAHQNPTSHFGSDCRPLLDAQRIDPRAGDLMLRMCLIPPLPEPVAARVERGGFVCAFHTAERAGKGGPRVRDRGRIAKIVG